MTEQPIEAQPAALADALDDLDACLHQAHQAVHGLLDALGGCPPQHLVRAGGLRMLLVPVADQLDQAALDAQLLVQAGQHPPG